MGYFDELIGQFEPTGTNTDNWNKTDAQKAIDRRKLLAQKMQTWRPNGDLTMYKSGYTSGGLTNPLSTLAALASTIAGTKLEDSVNKDQDAADAKSRQYYEDGLKAYKESQRPITGEELANRAVATAKKWEESDRQQAQQPSPARIEQMAADPNYKPPEPSDFSNGQPQLTPTQIEAQVVGGGLNSQPVAVPASSSFKRTKSAKASTTPAAPITYTSGNQVTMPDTGAGGGRGGQGGPTAAQMADYERQQRIAAIPGIDAANLARPNEIWSGMPGYVDGIDKIGQSQLTPTQIEAQVVGGGLNSQPVVQPTAQPTTTAPKTSMSKSRAAKAAQVTQGAGGGRGGQGGPTAQERADYEATQNQSVQDTPQGVDPVLAAQAQYRDGLAQQAINDAHAAAIDDRTSKLNFARSRLAASGDKGQRVLDAIDAAELSPVDEKSNWVLTKDGGAINIKTRERIGGDAPANKNTVVPSGSIVMDSNGNIIADNRQQGPTAQERKQAAQEQAANTANNRKSMMALQQAQDGINNINALLSSGRLSQASGTLSNAASNKLGTALGITTDTRSARADYTKAINNALPVVMEYLGALNNNKGFSGMMNTEGEMRKMMSIQAQTADPSMFTEAQLRNNLVEVLNSLHRVAKYHQEQLQSGQGGSNFPSSRAARVAPDGSTVDPNF